MSRKRKREALNVDVRLAEIYEDLANEDENVQLKAAQALISQVDPANGGTREAIEKALNRLFRGLCSGRKAARLGFSITLTELLSLLFTDSKIGTEKLDLTVEKTLDILESVTTPAGDTSGQEIRDHHFGRLFGAEAFLKSSALYDARSSDQAWRRLVGLIFNLAVKKPWLREECGWIVFSAILQLPSKAYDSSYAEIAIEQLKSHQLTRTPEGVSIWLIAKKCFPMMKLPSNVWHREDPLSSKDKQILAKVMKESSVVESGSDQAESNSQKGYWNANLHFAWEVVLGDLYAAQNTKEPTSKRLVFADFWDSVVDNGLFAPSSSSERKYWGFQLFTKVIKDAPNQFAAISFSKNVMRCLMNQLNEEDRHLHRVAERALAAVLSRIASDPNFALAAVKGLLGPHGSIDFDRITKTKTIDKALASSRLDTVVSIAKVFKSLILEPSGTDDSAAFKRQILADHLVSMIRAKFTNSKSLDTNELLRTSKEIMSDFVDFGYFLDSKSKPPMTTVSREMFRSRIISCLNTMLSFGTDAADVSCGVVDMIHKKQDGDSTAILVVELDDDAKQAVDGARRVLGKVNKKENRLETSQQAPLRAFRLLYSLTLLQVYNGDPDAVGLLDELKEFYGKLRGFQDPDAASETLVEILLSFASKPFKFFARTGQEVFGIFSAHVSEAGLQVLFNILQARENLEGQHELFDAQDDSAGDDLADDSGSEPASDMEMESVDVKQDDKESQEDGSSSDSESSNDNDNEELLAFESKLAAALGTHRGDEDLNASDRESSSDEDMDDDEMEKLDGHLAEIFKARKNAVPKKKERKDAKETMIIFKGRVLDLLEAYLKRQYSNELVLTLLLPLLQLIRTTNTKHLRDKACNLIRELNRLNKAKDLAKITNVEKGWEILRQIHKEAGRDGSHAHSIACSQSSLLLAKTLVGHREEAIDGVVDIYGQTRKRQLRDKKCQVPPAFFTEWNNWCVSAREKLSA